MKIVSRASPEGLAGHIWRAGHGLSSTDALPCSLSMIWMTANLIHWVMCACQKEFWPN